VLRATLTGRDKIAEQDVTSSLQQEMAKLRSNCGDKELAALNALFVRSPDELASIKVPLPSALPADLPAGALLRVGPNARPGDPIPGFFDGDGMVNAVVIPPGDQGKGSDHVFFGRKWVRTRAFKIEEEKQILFEGIMCAPRGWPIMKGLLSNFIRTGYPLKDTANTAISFHAGKILSRMEQGLPSIISVSQDANIETVEGASNLDGAIPFEPLTGGALAAHSKIDPKTGEMVSVTYVSGMSTHARHDVWNSEGRLTHSAEVPLPSGVMIHDLAITPKYSLILDLPLTIDPFRSFLDRFPVQYDANRVSRIGLISRHGGADDVIWCDVKPCVVLHTANSYEREDGKVVLYAFRSIPESADSYIIDYTVACLYEWIFDPATGKCVSERYLSTMPLEFPMINQDYTGSSNKFVYAIAPYACGGPVKDYSTPRETLIFKSAVKLDMHTGQVLETWWLPDDEYLVSEPTFVRKTGGLQEDDGYILCISSTVKDGRRTEEGSFLNVLDAKNLSPQHRIQLPSSVPYGLHSEFVPWAGLK